MRFGARLIGVACVLLALGHADAAETKNPLKLERVVQVMRHGIRPPTKATVTPPGIAREPWPTTWSVPYGHLTQHGADAIKLLGTYDKAQFVTRGLLATACPKAGEVAIWSDTDERTIRTGDVMAQALFPNCKVLNGHLAENANDPLFHPLEGPVKLDDAQSKAAVQKAIGTIDALRAKHRASFDVLQKILGCCAPEVCAAAKLPANCRMADLPADVSVEKSGERPDLTGPFDYGPSAAQTLALEYAEGLPMEQVGWGRATQKDVAEALKLHSMKGDVLQRPDYLAVHGAGNLARRILDALNGKGEGNGTKLTLLVGHDTNIGDLSGLFDFTWQVDTYPADTTPPGSGPGFELLSDASGNTFVRAIYRSQTMEQMRNLTPLDAAHPAFHQVLALPGCSTPQDKTICTLADFNKLVESKLAAAK